MSFVAVAVVAVGVAVVVVTVAAAGGGGGAAAAGGRISFDRLAWLRTDAAVARTRTAYGIAIRPLLKAWSPMLVPFFTYPTALVDDRFCLSPINHAHAL